MAWYSGIVKLFKRAPVVVKDLGLTDELLLIAKGAVRLAEAQLIDNATRREFAVAFLVGKGVPESIARLAVEVAVRLIKKEIESHA